MAQSPHYSLNLSTPPLSFPPLLSKPPSYTWTTPRASELEILSMFPPKSQRSILLPYFVCYPSSSFFQVLACANPFIASEFLFFVSPAWNSLPSFLSLQPQQLSQVLLPGGDQWLQWLWGQIRSDALLQDLTASVSFPSQHIQNSMYFHIYVIID